MTDLTPTVSKARYAKNQMAVSCPGDGTGFKTRAMRLCEALKGRYSHREKSYIMSPTKSEKLKKLYTEGWDAKFLSNELVPPKSKY